MRRRAREEGKLMGAAENKNMDMMVVGLGLIGGSIARRLRGFRAGRILGVDRDAQTRRLALSDGVVDEAYADGAQIGRADLILLCLYPQANIEFVRANRDRIKAGAVLTDVSGVKGYVLREMEEILPPGADFVGGHPMAGREVGGYQSSTDTLFEGASYLITPTKRNKPENVALVRELAAYIGCKHVVATTPEEHDAVVAYTSQLMHVVAVALCNNPMIERSAFFSAGSLRDCTRVAVINETMWSELFLENREQLAARIAEMQAGLQEIADALAAGDRDGLEQIMRRASAQKLKWLME